MINDETLIVNFVTEEWIDMIERGLTTKVTKKVAYSLRLRVSFLHRDHANLLCILSCLCNVPIRRPERLESGQY
jgi:hypothetical protein